MRRDPTHHAPETHTLHYVDEDDGGVTQSNRLSCDLLVVFRRQINSVLVSRGGEVALQTLDLLGVFLSGHKHESALLPSRCSSEA